MNEKERLLKIEKQLGQLETEKNVTVGREQELLRSIESKFGLKTREQIEKFLEDLNKKIEKRRTILKDKVIKLEEKLEW